MAQNAFGPRVPVITAKEFLRWIAVDQEIADALAENPVAHRRLASALAASNQENDRPTAVDHRARMRKAISVAFAHFEHDRQIRGTGSASHAQGECVGLDCWAEYLELDEVDHVAKLFANQDRR